MSRRFEIAPIAASRIRKDAQRQREEQLIAEALVHNRTLYKNANAAFQSTGLQIFLEQKERELKAMHGSSLTLSIYLPSEDTGVHKIRAVGHRLTWVEMDGGPVRKEMSLVYHQSGDLEIFWRQGETPSKLYEDQNVPSTLLPHASWSRYPASVIAFADAAIADPLNTPILQSPLLATSYS